MQIVRDLGGYTLGRSDLVRRAMSKKKQSVMEKERANFVYGNEAEGVPGCVKNGISESVASHIYDEMMDFAKYAFNKSHAACYAVVAYQTAFLKYYYPVEFMAALMTSVIDNSSKVSEYILTCRNMGIEVLPPDVNMGESGFFVQNGKIRYALTAIKGVGRPVIEALSEERKAAGPFKSLQDLITRMAGRDLNKRVIESCIKAGALDSLGGTRKQFMAVYAQIMEHVVHDKKNAMAGQLSLFDLVSEKDKSDFDIPLPDIGEYDKAMLLAFEKEVLGIYLSGHPLEEWEELWRRQITNTSADFAMDEDTQSFKVRDQAMAIVGGMITGKSIKYTKNNDMMAFLTLEDLLGTMEIVVFPKSYSEYSSILLDEAKIFVRGRVSLKEEQNGNLICEQIITFEEAKDVKGPIFQNRRGDTRNAAGSKGFSGTESTNKENAVRTPTVKTLPKGVWLQFQNMEAYKEKEKELFDIIARFEGDDNVVIYLKEGKQIRLLPASRLVRADEELKARLAECFGEENVKFRF